ncbi:META domain-containing protein [Streptomyces sp. NPDC046557]|uniref:META domain-containing protein n=1 Tax=Streptomyces sp. NPDC046557 TaxID=3155372 RepID=UPI0033FC5ACF
MRAPRPLLPAAALTAVLALVGATACGAQDAPPRPVHSGTVDAKPSPQPVPDAPLTVTEWTVTALGRDGTASAVPADLAGTARFTLAGDGSASGGLGCNRFTAEAAVAGASLTFGPPATTRMACEGPAGEVERALTTLFESGPLTWRIQGRTLTLTGADGAGLTAEAASAAE